jgi:hypothetical protein
VSSFEDLEEAVACTNRFTEDSRPVKAFLLSVLIFCQSGRGSSSVAGWVAFAGTLVSLVSRSSWQVPSFPRDQESQIRVSPFIDWAQGSLSRDMSRSKPNFLLRPLSMPYIRAWGSEGVFSTKRTVVVS